MAALESLDAAARELPARAAAQLISRPYPGGAAPPVVPQVVRAVVPVYLVVRGRVGGYAQ